MVVLGIGVSLVKFDYEKMLIFQNVWTKDLAFNFKKVNDETFLKDTL